MEKTYYIYVRRIDDDVNAWTHFTEVRTIQEMKEVVSYIRSKKDKFSGFRVEVAEVLESEIF